ncbi:hypothetical protein Pint_19872 [Pistacia integerrima]|uniref:Uncharacterized protein n=1 Tax=Pistacia integerrima TaxID=434235 RepID=A0ACC0XFA6_9ROSI|nr:hypothetical protein Pint_19872 [Pistacia integerrima]
MDCKSFEKLCYLLKTHGRLQSTRHTSVEEMVGSFLHIVAHHVKNRVMKRQIVRLGETNSVLNVVLRLHIILLTKPKPIPENSTDEQGKWFKNYLGALDGIYIKVHVHTVDNPRYQSRKNEIATNVLGVCTPSMQFITGFYYLCDAGYTNGEGFLTPYRGQRYHLTKWRQGCQLATPQEFFNRKHSQARNCIERCFGILKKKGLF